MAIKLIIKSNMASVNTFPDFAVVCSFLERYSEHLQLPEVTITDLETAIGYAHCGKKNVWSLGATHCDLAASLFVVVFFSIV